MARTMTSDINFVKDVAMDILGQAISAEEAQEAYDIAAETSNPESASVIMGCVEEFQGIFQAQLVKEEARLEAMRGTGECFRCHKVFSQEQIEEEFRVRNPITGETKLSLACSSCRKVDVEQMKADFVRREKK